MTTISINAASKKSNAVPYPLRNPFKEIALFTGAMALFVFISMLVGNIYI